MEGGQISLMNSSITRSSSMALLEGRSTIFASCPSVDFFVFYIRLSVIVPQPFGSSFEYGLLEQTFTLVFDHSLD